MMTRTTAGMVYSLLGAWQLRRRILCRRAASYWRERRRDALIAAQTLLGRCSGRSPPLAWRRSAVRGRAADVGGCPEAFTALPAHAAASAASPADKAGYRSGS